MPDPIKVPLDQVERTKKWMLMKFRQSLRGARVTEQITRFLGGEFGDEVPYRFQTETVLNEEGKKFINDPKNFEKLNQERLI
jgi:hypothetical protein